MLTLPMMFADHMVLQRNKQLNIFGQAEPGALVLVRLIGGGKTVERRKYAEADGAFCVHIPPQPAGYGHTMEITDGTDTVRIEDVAIGEVWLAGGQSNMEYLMDTDAEKKDEQAAIEGDEVLK